MGILHLIFDNDKDRDQFERRFWSRVDRLGQCWEWTQGCSAFGYGAVNRRQSGIDRQYRTHRVAYELAYGAIPDHLHVCHRCDNRKCCRPEHLFLGTAADNALDRDTKGRGSTKLTATDARNIRTSYAQGVPMKQLAEQYGVRYVSIRAIVRRESWRHVD